MAITRSAVKKLNGSSTDWIIKAVITALLAWGLNEISHIRREISDIKSNRFTDEDGNRVEEGYASLRADIENKADKENVPPPEIIRWLERIETRLRDLEVVHRSEEE